MRCDPVPIAGARIVLHRRPLPAVFDVAPKFLKSVAAVGSRKNIHASVVVIIFDADENGPRSVDVPGHEAFLA